MVHALAGGLFVGDHLANFVDVLSEFGDFVGPGAFGVGVGLSGGKSAFGLSEAFGQVVQSVLEGGAGHNKRLSF